MWVTYRPVLLLVGSVTTGALPGLSEPWFSHRSSADKMNITLHEVIVRLKENLCKILRVLK